MATYKLWHIHGKDCLNPECFLFGLAADVAARSAAAAAHATAAAVPGCNNVLGCGEEIAKVFVKVKRSVSKVQRGPNLWLFFVTGKGKANFSSTAATHFDCILLLHIFSHVECRFIGFSGPFHLQISEEEKSEN